MVTEVQCKVPFKLTVDESVALGMPHLRFPALLLSKSWVSDDGVLKCSYDYDKYDFTPFSVTSRKPFFTFVQTGTFSFTCGVLMQAQEFAKGQL